MTAHSLHYLLAVVVAVVVVIARFRSLGISLAVTLAALVLSNGSLISVKESFLTARWGALAGAALVLAPEARRLTRRDLAVVAGVMSMPLLGLVSAAWSVEPRLTVERSFAFGLLLFVVALAAISMSRDVAERDAVVDALAVLVALVVVASLLEVAVDPARGELNGQWRGLFENPNGLGLFLGLTFPLVAASLVRRFGALYVGVAFVVVVVLTLLSESRSGLLGLFVVVAAVVLARRKAVRVLALGLLAAAVIVVGAVAVTRGSSAPAQRGPVLFAVTPGEHSPRGKESLVARITGARSEAWSASAGLIGSRPFFGYGFGTGDRLFGRYPDRVDFTFFEGDNPNNAYVQLALELGVVGGLLFILPLLAAAGLALRRLVHGPQWTSEVSFATLLAAGLAVAVVESVFTSPGSPWELLIWLAATVSLTAGTQHAVSAAYQPARITSDRRVVVAVATVASVVLAAGVVAAILTSGLPSPKTPERAADALARRACGSTGCRVKLLEHIQGSLWWIGLGSGTRPATCYVVDVSRFEGDGSSRAEPGSVDRSGCRPLPTARPHALSVGVLDPAPPYFNPPGSNPTGLEPTLVRALAVRLRIALVTWAQASPEAVAPQTDFDVHALYSGYRPPPGYVPYLPIPDVLVARRGTAGTAAVTSAQAARLKLGVIDAEGVVAVRQLGVSPARRDATLAAGLAALKRNDVQGLVVNLGDAVGVVAQDAQLVAVARFRPHVFYALRFPPDSGLRPLVVRALARLAGDGTLGRIQKMVGKVPTLPLLR